MYSHRSLNEACQLNFSDNRSNRVQFRVVQTRSVRCRAKYTPLRETRSLSFWCTTCTAVTSKVDLLVLLKCFEVVTYLQEITVSTVHVMETKSNFLLPMSTLNLNLPKHPLIPWDMCTYGCIASKDLTGWFVCAKDFSKHQHQKIWGVNFMPVFYVP